MLCIKMWGQTWILTRIIPFYFQSLHDSGLGEYATIHVTPQPAFSYVSFETNLATESYMDLVLQVINTFLPGKFIITFYATWVSKQASEVEQDVKII